MNHSAVCIVGVLLTSLCWIFAASLAQHDPCPAFTDSLVRCLLYDTNETFGGCSTCVLSSVPDDVVSCAQLEFHLCQALSTCPCSNCRREYGAFLRCMLESKLRDFDCQLECPDLPEEDSSTTTPYDPVEDCKGFRVLAARCYVENNLTVNNAVACHSCIFNDVQQSSRLCTDRGLAVCTALSSCPCEPCEVVELSYWSCVLHTSQNCSLPCDVKPFALSVSSTIT